MTRLSFFFLTAIEFLSSYTYGQGHIYFSEHLSIYAFLIKKRLISYCIVSATIGLYAATVTAFTFSKQGIECG